MPDHILPALIVFGVMFAACMVGLWTANAQSKRLNATTRNPDQADVWRDRPTQFSNLPRR